MRLFFIIILFIETSVLADIKKINVGITISGGVSLGAYEAGFSYYLTETLKANQTTEFRPKYYTGASAGGINSLLSLIESCSYEETDLESSLFGKYGYPWV